MRELIRVHIVITLFFHSDAQSTGHIVVFILLIKFSSIIVSTYKWRNSEYYSWWWSAVCTNFKRPQETRPKRRKDSVHSPEIHNMCKATQRMEHGPKLEVHAYLTMWLQTAKPSFWKWEKSQVNVLRLQEQSCWDQHRKVSQAHNFLASSSNNDAESLMKEPSDPYVWNGEMSTPACHVWYFSGL